MKMKLMLCGEKLTLNFKEYLYVTLTAKNQLNDSIKNIIFKHTDIYNKGVDSSKSVFFIKF